MTAELFEALDPFVDILVAMRVDYYIGGSVASSIYGALRATNDVDVVTRLEPANITQLADSLGTRFYFDTDAMTEAVRTKCSFNVIHLTSALKIDVFCPERTPYQEGVFRRANLGMLDPRRPDRLYAIGSPEDIVLTKLRWYHQGQRQSDLQLRDVRGILRVRKGLDTGYLRSWAKSLAIADVLDILLRECGL